ncbi:MAG: alpha-amylase family glycosyl hydrolase [Bacteroidota bacterium]
MKKVLLSVSIVMLFSVAKSQLLTWTPQFPSDNSTLVITVDATKGNQGLNNYADPNNIYVHTGVTTNLSGNGGAQWLYTNGSTGAAWGSATPALKAVSLGNNKYQYTITNIRSFFGVPAAETIKTVNILFRDANANASLVKKQANTDGSDMYIPVFAAGANRIQFTQPNIVPSFVISNESITASLSQTVPVTAVASTNAGTLRLYFNGTQIVGPLTGTNTITGNAVVSVAGNQQVVSELVVGGNSYYDTVQFYVAPVNTVLALPAGVKEGINYGEGCDSVTLVLYAPNKQNVVILGDFPGCGWIPQTQFQMNKTPDNNYYWFTIRGLTPGFEYSFQYLVDNSIYIADPYSEKVLDPWNDQYIPVSTYPDLKPIPSDPNFSAGKNGYVSVLRTCEPAYNWKMTNFSKPDKRNLVIYEILVRDFGAAKNYQMLIDSMNYFKNLGINAIELMPVAEFSGNESWGYNPTFYCALDKAYGTKNKFKEFIDVCHQNGIAVILDVVYNQLDAYNSPEGRLYWDPAGRPAANSPWFNQSAPHPYSVFEDLNHTSAATQYWVKRALEYWIKEYKVDGYRFDLAKGFTQTATTSTTVENFDNTRVANLNRYYDYIIPLYPDTYMILEFLGQQRLEEQIYATKGYMLWSECTDQYTQASMGYVTNSDLSKMMYNSSQTSFSTPSAVGYMESHDKDRLMYKNVNFGNTNGGYNVKDTTTALKRMAAVASVFLTTPGPKMIWQFGERGYDQTIGLCENGTINENDCRTSNKPPQWNKFSEQRRKDLYEAFSKLINLRVSNPNLFNSTNFSYSFYDNNGLYKKYQIADNAANGLKLAVVSNLDVTAQTRDLTFQNTGNWFNYLSNGTGAGINGPSNASFNVASATQSITLQPGEFHVYLYHPTNVYIFNGNGNWSDASNWTYGIVPPATLPNGSEILVNPKQGGTCTLNVSQTISTGAKITVAAGKNILIPLNLSIQ